MVRFYLILFFLLIEIYFLGLSSESFIEDRLHNKRNINPLNSLSSTVSEPSHVQKIIDRLESISSQSSDNKKEKKISIKQKSLHDDHSDGSTSLTSSPPVKRIARRDYNDKNLTNGNSKIHEESFVIHQNGSHTEISVQNNEKSNEIKFELNREEIINGVGRRTTSGTTVSFSFKKKKIINDSYLS
jgi:hypothetical protein